MEKPKILIADGDPEFQALFQGPAAGAIEVEFVPTQREAQLRIADKTVHFSGLCLNAAICEPFATPLVRFAKVHRPATPVFLLLNAGSLTPEAELLEGLHIHHCLQKPLSPGDLINTIFPYSVLEIEKLVNLGKLDAVAVDQNLNEEDKAMHAISAQDFLCGSKSFFDVYVRLAGGKYVKLLKAGDQFDQERVMSYLKKGVTQFYMRKEAQELFLQYCDKLTGAILAKEDVSIEVKSDQVLNFGKETASYLTTRGCNDVTLQAAFQFVRHAHSLTRALQPSVLDGFLEKVGLCTHGTGTVMIVSLMLKELGYEDKKVVEVIALSAMYHDIGLLTAPEKLQEEDESEFTDEEKKEFRLHPEKGEAMVKAIKRMSPLVPQVILQHHERRNRSGFPQRLGHGAIAPVAELVGLADEFNNLIRKAAKQPDLDPYQEMDFSVFPLFSTEIVAAFKKTFPKSGKIAVKWKAPEGQ